MNKKTLPIGNFEMHEAARHGTLRPRRALIESQRVPWEDVSAEAFKKALRNVKETFAINKRQVRKLGVLLCAFLSGCTPAIAGLSLIDAIAQVESSGNAKAIGDGGRSIGAYQLSAACWRDVQKVEPRVGEYLSGAPDPARSRLAARTYLTILAARFHRATNRTPTPGELYGCYNVGFSRFQSLGFDLKRAPKTTQKAVKKLEGLMR